MQDGRSISVVIVNWNSKDDLRECLASLESQSDRDFDTIVVDNGSTDGSIEMLSAEFSATRLVATGENLGFAEGCNRGILESRGAWVATLNNDAVASPTWIAELRAAADAGPPKLAMIQSRILFKHDLGRMNSTGVLICSDGAFIDRDYDRLVKDTDSGDEVFCASAGAAMYRRTMLDELRLDTGYFDRSFFMYYEDVDLGWRGRLAGWTTRYVPSATVYHAFHASAARRGNQFVFAHCYRNRLRVLLKNASLSYILQSSPRVIRELLWCISRRGPKALGEYWKAFADGYSQRKVVEQLRRVERRAVERSWIVDAQLK